MSDELKSVAEVDEATANAIYKELHDYAAKTHGVIISKDDPFVPLLVYQHKLFQDALKAQADRIKGENYVCLADFAVQESRMLQNYRKQVATTSKKSGETAVTAFMEATEKERSRVEGQFKVLATEVKDTIIAGTGKVDRQFASLKKVLRVCTLVNTIVLLANICIAVQMTAR